VEFVILSGLSGAGKSTVQNVLEDMGYFTIDNLPPCLWIDLIKKCHPLSPKGIALVIDVRAGNYLKDFEDSLEDLKAEGIKPIVVFLDANDIVLIKRYNLTRRTHPIGKSTLSGDIMAERKLLEPIRSAADMVIDSSRTSARELKDVILSRFSKEQNFNLYLRSFGFKRGVPIDADIVLDVRSMPNPYYDKKLRSKPGTSPEVQKYVFDANSLEFYTKLREFVRELAESAEASGRSNYNLAIGCTGGQHRSVAVVERLASDLADSFKLHIFHRDLPLALDEHKS